MALEYTDRLALSTYTSGTDMHPTRTEFNDRMQLLDSLVAITRQGAHADRPTAGIRGTIWYSTDRREIYLDTGTEWERVDRIGQGGTPAAPAFGGSGSEGTSRQAARADHVHPLPLATSTSHGGMSSGDKAKLDRSTQAGTPNTLVERDDDGRARISSPVDSTHITNKQYVDQQINTRAPSSHTHPAGDITGTLALARIPDLPASRVTSGEFNSNRLPLATVSNRGALSTTHFSMLSSATPNNTGGTLVQRNSSGHFAIPAPTSGGHPTNRDYVTQQINTRAPSSHTHAASEITTGSFALARIPALPASQIGSGVLDRSRLPAAAATLAGVVELQNLVNWGGSTTANLNTLIRAGFYYITGSNANMPSTAGTASLLLVIAAPHHDDMTAQLLFNMNQNRLYFRTQHTSGWRSWIELS
ncbi:pyocin knob domain-containing protein [Nesterenkonia flava]|uniref:Pyocin knob domain-containing protein n=1 Tax=Nesterenkonia flava TaxID=469799 RepID=A0ABU1FRU1_9MICC|nr:pyocin knob domain-containing protein [Nesterenkonia flava]MDR5711388.1 pyocin knob domain-containing protein [Nesterenkonia flava]